MPSKFCINRAGLPICDNFSFPFSENSSAPEFVVAIIIATFSAPYFFTKFSKYILFERVYKSLFVLVLKSFSDIFSKSKLTFPKKKVFPCMKLSSFSRCLFPSVIAVSKISSILSPRLQIASYFVIQITVIIEFLFRFN